MFSKKRRLTCYYLLFCTAIILSIAFASKGVIKNDPEKNIYIPDELIISLNVKAAFNKEKIFWKFEWDADSPSYYHKYLVFENGQWTAHGQSSVGPEREGMYEDRLSFFIDDGKVEYFSQYGGFITIVHDMRFMTADVSQEEAKKFLKKKDVRKFLPETRKNPLDWRTIRPEEEINQLVESGYFLDLWHWRAHRSNPIGFADDQYVSWYRLGDPGKAPYTANWDKTLNQPKFMFDSNKTGLHALEWEKLKNRQYSQKELYYLSDEFVAPFDSNRVWKEGDTIPYHLLQKPTESRGSILAKGIWYDGKWDVQLIRNLSSANLTSDKTLKPYGKYTIAFAVHKNATGSRWHYVSYPFTFGLERNADIVAQKFSGNEPPWDTIAWTTLPLIYPGQISWDHLFSKGHAGYCAMKNKIPLKMAHTPQTLALYAVESEFRKEIRLQWLMTLMTWTILFITLVWAIARCRETKDFP